MPKPPQLPDDPILRKIRQAMKDVEPRPEPTETITVNHGFGSHTGWKCPICGAFCRRHDRNVYQRRYGTQETVIDYGGYNMHFSANHATPFWKEQHLLDVVKDALK